MNTTTHVSCCSCMFHIFDNKMSSETTSATIVETRTIYLKDPVPIKERKALTPSDILSRHRQRSGENPLECSLHTLPELLKREFYHVFREECKNMPDSIPSSDENDQTPILLAIPTNQKAKEDLVAVGEHIEDEKNRLLNVVSQCMENT